MFTYIITIKIAKALTQISAFSTYAFVVFTTSFIMTYRSSVTKESYESSIDSWLIDVMYLEEAFEDEPQ